MMLEAGTLSILGGTAGVVAGLGFLLGLKGLIEGYLNVTYLWPDAGVFALVVGSSLLLALASGLGAAAVPALRSSLMEPYHAIRTGE